MLYRDDARTVLVAMARELGPLYLPFICEVLAAALPARGYTAHVLGHTVHAVVEGLHKAREETPQCPYPCCYTASS